MTRTSIQSERRRTGRARWIPFAAGATAAALTVAAVATAGGGAAGAATTPRAQSAGNFVDATIGGNPIDDIAKLAFARAQNPGSVTDQNPLDVTVLNAINLPLTGALQLPQLLGITLGAANQVALAKSTGASYGAAGAVLNSGGVSVGGNNASRPANATIDLTASGISGNSPVPVPGGGESSADALGGVTASIGAVSSIARVPAFGPPLASSWLQSCTQASATCYQIASVDLSLGSPLVGQILGTVTDTLDSVLAQLATAAGNVGLPSACSFSVGFGSISLENGAVMIDSQTGSITFT
ncbi:MAG: choice-of-anchor G family protein [Pseudonocardiales bacterium]